MMSKQYRNRLKMGMKMGMKKCSTAATTQYHFPQNMETQLWAVIDFQKKQLSSACQQERYGRMHFSMHEIFRP